ncbi:hypothetical protein BVC80_9101g129 [Macleaya cordata]|uniref:Beta-1,3-N-Acetylglucosaminyltransferase family protein n=1 Tax=Macleaya cordata TaxID=56857 RepID=A0A200QGI5_MACCD|nr:hypothetical protein BVC80_9101g129 [Macleaya cordata]
MASSSCLKIFYTFLLLTILLEGACATTCDLSSLRITQTITTRQVAGKPEYEVNVSNWCACAQSNVRLRCAGFKTVEKIDPAVLKQDNEFCLLLSGKPLKQNADVQFRYASDTPYNFTVASSKIQCN